MEPEGLTMLGQKAMRDVSFFLRPAHQEKVASVLKDPSASENDRFVANTLLKNSVIAAEGLEGTEEFGDIEMYVVGETMYIRLGEEWMSAPAEGDPIEIPLSEDDLPDSSPE